MFLYMFLYLIGCVSWILWGLRWISARCSSLWSEPVRWNEQYCQRWSRKACKAVAYVVLCMTTVKGPRPSSRYWNFDRIPFFGGWHSAYWFALELSKCIAELKLVIDFESPWGIQKPLQLPVLTLSVTQTGAFWISKEFLSSAMAAISTGLCHWLHCDGCSLELSSADSNSNDPLALKLSYVQGWVTQWVSGGMLNPAAGSLVFFAKIWCKTREQCTNVMIKM